MGNYYDDKELLIVSKLWKIIDMEKCNHKISKIKEEQLNFFTRAIINILSNDNRQNTYSDFINTSLICTDLANLKIVGNENYEQVNYQDGLIVVSNHLGSSKLTKITKEELRNQLQKINFEWEIVNRIDGFINDDPFLILVAGLIKSIKTFIDLSTAIISVALIDFPFPINEVALDCNHFMISRQLYEQYEIFEKKLQQKIRIAKELNKIPICIVFPEGGTSGKQNSQTPFTLEKFRRGFAVFACENKIPILPIIQLFDNEFNFYTKILKFRFINNTPDINSLDIQTMMQEQLNTLINENNNRFRT